MCVTNEEGYACMCVCVVLCGGGCSKQMFFYSSLVGRCGDGDGRIWGCGWIGTHSLFFSYISRCRLVGWRHDVDVVDDGGPIYFRSLPTVSYKLG